MLSNNLFLLKFISFCYYLYLKYNRFQNTELFATWKRTTCTCNDDSYSQRKQRYNPVNPCKDMEPIVSD